MVQLLSELPPIEEETLPHGANCPLSPFAATAPASPFRLPLFLPAIYLSLCLPFVPPRSLKILRLLSIVMGRGVWSPVKTRSIWQRSGDRRGNENCFGFSVVPWL